MSKYTPFSAPAALSTQLMIMWFLLALLISSNIVLLVKEVDREGPDEDSIASKAYDIALANVAESLNATEPNTFKRLEIRYNTNGTTEALTLLEAVIDAMVLEIIEGFNHTKLVGPTGERGPRGYNGTAGPAGDAGPAGPAGPAGDAGDAGPAGPAGPAGNDGQDGTLGCAVCDQEVDDSEYPEIYMAPHIITGIYLTDSRITMHNQEDSWTILSDSDGHLKISTAGFNPRVDFVADRIRVPGNEDYATDIETYFGHVVRASGGIRIGAWDTEENADGDVNVDDWYTLHKLDYRASFGLVVNSHSFDDEPSDVPVKWMRIGDMVTMVVGGLERDDCENWSTDEGIELMLPNGLRPTGANSINGNSYINVQIIKNSELTQGRVNLAPGAITFEPLTGQSFTSSNGESCGFPETVLHWMLGENTNIDIEEYVEPKRLSKENIEAKKAAKLARDKARNEKRAAKVNEERQKYEQVKSDKTKKMMEKGSSTGSLVMDV
jgi:hypothetical protein